MKDEESDFHTNIFDTSVFVEKSKTLYNSDEFKAKVLEIINEYHGS